LLCSPTLPSLGTAELGYQGRCESNEPTSQSLSLETPHLSSGLAAAPARQDPLDRPATGMTHPEEVRNLPERPMPLAPLRSALAAHSRVAHYIAERCCKNCFLAAALSSFSHADLVLPEISERSASLTLLPRPTLFHRQGSPTEFLRDSFDGGGLAVFLPALAHFLATTLLATTACVNHDGFLLSAALRFRSAAAYYGLDEKKLGIFLSDSSCLFSFFLCALRSRRQLHSPPESLNPQTARDPPRNLRLHATASVFSECALSWCVASRLCSFATASRSQKKAGDEFLLTARGPNPKSQENRKGSQRLNRILLGRCRVKRILLVAVTVRRLNNFPAPNNRVNPAFAEIQSQLARAPFQHYSANNDHRFHVSGVIHLFDERGLLLAHRGDSRTVLRAPPSLDWMAGLC
jgi:hypothetical protein